MTKSISPTNCQKVHWYSWKVLLKNSTTGLHKLCAAWLGLYTIIRNFATKECMNSKAKM